MSDIKKCQSIFFHRGLKIRGILINKHVYDKQYDNLIRGYDTAAACVYMKKSDCKSSSVFADLAHEHSMMRDRSLFWQRLWQYHSKPACGIIYDIMKSTRKQYRYKIKKLKSKQVIIKEI